MQPRTVLLFVCFVSLTVCEWVYTPFGHHPSECVHHVAEDEIASFDDTDQMFRIRRQVMLDNGKDSFEVIEEYPRCNVSISPRQSRITPNGWAAYAEWLTHTKFTTFGGVWSVPDYPKQEGLQTLFLFTGLQNSETADVTIIQPVLQWGNSDAGDSKNWTIASWFVGGSHASYSDLIGPLTPGDTIVGNMTLNASGKWTIVTADSTTGQSTTLTVATEVNEVDAFVTLEVYGINSCADYPNGDDTFSSLWLEADGTHQEAKWIPRTEIGCSESVVINNPSSVTVKF